jgi:nitroreductase
MQKSSTIEHPISDLMRNRRSLRAFSSQAIETDKINSLFEATRWAPSSSNEQPWLYMYATRNQTELWSKFFDCLNDGNKIWMLDAPMLIVSLARKVFSRYDSENSHALYDLGGANAFLSLQAVEMGLQVRQMAGFSHSLAKQNLNIPDSYQLGVFMAVGYPGDPTRLPEKLQLRESAPRERFLQQEFVMNKIFE